MSNTLDLLELLENISPSGRCDDCLSTELGIQPRQTVNIICRRFREAKKIERFKASCSLCGKVKLINTLASPSSYGTIDTKKRKASTESTSKTEPAPPIDVEKTRTDIVHICRKLWQRTQTSEWPRSISAVIGQLRSNGEIPNHQANMMLTLCNLRNVHVYEDIELGRREMTIAVNAAGIVTDWWLAKQEGAK